MRLGHGELAHSERGGPQAGPGRRQERRVRQALRHLEGLRPQLQGALELAAGLGMLAQPLQDADVLRQRATLGPERLRPGIGLAHLGRRGPVRGYERRGEGEGAFQLLLAACRGVRQPVQERHGTVQVGGRLGIRRPPQGRRRGLLPIARGPAGVASVRKVQRQLGGALAGLRAIARLQPRPQTLM